MGGPSNRRTDPASMRRANMGLILRHLRDQGGRSRAVVAAETGLSKATMATLIADLVDRGLVHEGKPDRAGGIGRPGLTVSIDGRRVCGVGVEINVDYLSLVAVDLSGTVIRESTRPIDAARLSSAEVVGRVADLLTDGLASLREAGITPVGISVAAPGFTEIDTGCVRFAPNIGWRDVALVDDLTTLLGSAAPPIDAENDVKLGAVAEYAQVAPSGDRDLLYLTGDVGVGAGIIAGGQLLRGTSGFAGEVGHLPLDAAMEPCACGRYGCWETAVGLTPFLLLAADADDVVHDTTRPLEDRLRELRRRADGGDERTVAALARIGERLGLGISMLADVLNPRLIVLGGYFGWFEDHLVPPVAELLAKRSLNPTADVCRVVGFRLGLTSAARGGAHHALEAVFADPTVVAA